MKGNSSPALDASANVEIARVRVLDRECELTDLIHHDRVVWGDDLDDRRLKVRRWRGRSSHRN